MRSFQQLSILALLALSVVGCGSGAPAGIVVTGQVLFDGKPMEVNRPDVGLGMIEVSLLPDPPGRYERELSKADQEGKFEFRGPGAGVPPGTYKLVVRHWKNGMGTKDELDGKFTEEQTPIKVEVPGNLIGKKFELGVLELKNYQAPAK